MGYIKHHAIMVVGAGYPEAQKMLRDIHAKAIELFDSLVTPIIQGKVNNYETFFIAPDGSKEGWDMSDDYDQRRGELVEYINSLAYDDGSNAVSHMAVWLDEDGECEIESHYKDGKCVKDGEDE